MLAFLRQDRVIELKASISRDISTAVSQISDRFYETMDAQPWRSYMYGVGADASAFSVMRGDKSQSGDIIMQRIEVMLYSMRANDGPLRWLLGLLWAPPEFGGFTPIDLPDVGLKCGTLGSDNLPIKYSRADGGKPTSPRVTLVFKVTVTPRDGGERHEAILKIGDSDVINCEVGVFSTQLAVLRHTGHGDTPSFTPKLALEVCRSPEMLWLFTGGQPQHALRRTKCC